MKYLPYIITFLISSSIGYFLGFLEAKYKIKSLKETLDTNDKNAQQYLKWLQEDMQKHLREHVEEMKKEIRKIRKIRR